MHYSSHSIILNRKYTVGIYWTMNKNVWRHYVRPEAYTPEKGQYHANKENYDNMFNFSNAAILKCCNLIAQGSVLDFTIRYFGSIKVPHSIMHTICSIWATYMVIIMCYPQFSFINWYPGFNFRYNLYREFHLLIFHLFFHWYSSIMECYERV